MASPLKSAISTQAADLAVSGEELVGKRLGVWRLTAVIGHGGMGTVYRAVRDDKAFEKEAALKVIRRGMDSANVVASFRRERQILALLDHPYIARLLDGGTTDDGLPFFVMEHVEGKPITEYCAGNGFSVPQRLHLFRDVCGAVQYAHGNLVMHRDLKPGNIFVTPEGTPKLLDFGLAKVVNPEAAENETMTGLRMLTPDYASPEQVRGEPVTTATDIYSLGVVLYELLAGRRPHEVEVRFLARPGGEDLPDGGAGAKHDRAGAAGGSRQHRADGAAEGAGAALRDGRAIRRRHTALPGRIAGSGAQGHARLSHPQVRPAQPLARGRGGARRGEPHRRNGGGDATGPPRPAASRAGSANHERYPA